jgi:hypothetical protein
MTIVDEGKQIRSEVAKLKPDKARRYSDVLRARILDWLGRATAAGMMESECSKAIGVKTWRFTVWRRARELKSESRALVRIETPDVELVGSGLAVVAPSGYRVEGLALAHVVVLLREFA